jgi:hypothetical protein
MKLAKLPERARVRLILQISPLLCERLKAYAELYERSYGTREEIAALVPFMIEAFLGDDKSFGKVSQKSVRNTARTAHNTGPEKPS